MRKRDHFQQFQRKRYATRRFRNPYFQHVQSRPWKPIALVILILATLIGGTSYLLSTPAFAIQDVVVEGTQSISPEEIKAIAEAHLDRSRLVFFNGSNFFLFDKEGLNEVLSSRYAFEQLDISRKKKTLSISLKEKTSQLIWKTAEDHYLVDLQGMVIRPLTLTEKEAVYAPAPEGPQPVTENGEAPPPIQVNPLTLLPRIVDVNQVVVTVGQSVMSAEEIQGVFRFHDHLKAQSISFTETWVDRVAGKWVSVKTTAGYDILFDPTGDTDLQASNLETLLRETIPDTTNLLYIDLRFGDHLYYKFR